MKSYKHVTYMLFIALSQTVLYFLNTSTVSQEMIGWQMVFLYHCFSAICLFLVVVANILSAFDSFLLVIVPLVLVDSHVHFCYKIASNCRGDACYCKVPDYRKIFKTICLSHFLLVLVFFVKQLLHKCDNKHRLVINDTRIAF